MDWWRKAHKQLLAFSRYIIFYISKLYFYIFINVCGSRLFSNPVTFVISNGRQVEGDNGLCIRYFLSDRRQVAMHNSKFSHVHTHFKRLNYNVKKLMELYICSMGLYALAIHQKIASMCKPIEHMYNLKSISAWHVN